MSAMLEIEHLEAAYGNSQVLFGVDLSIAPGEVATLLGRNGMGKTTCVRAIMGLMPGRRGCIRFRGARIDGLRADQIARLGIGIVPEGRQIFPNLTVRENLIAFAANRSQSSEPWGIDQVYALFPRLQSRSENMGNQLSGGEQQMLAVGRALMTNPHLLILDEATEGLAPLVREEIWQCLAQLKAKGQTILVIDKHIRSLLKISDQHSIIERGKIVWRGTNTLLAENPDLWHRHLGV